ncbi:MAG: Ig-like domain-containing protein [Bacteroidales bacterium]|nr:Ig-like domain-containing protein [Bacteroidales bacterium]
MSRTFFILFISAVLLFFSGCKKEKEEPPNPNKFQLSEIKAGNRSLSQGTTLQDVDVNSAFYLSFSEALDSLSLREGVIIENESASQTANIDFKLENKGQNLVIRPAESFQWFTTYSLSITSKLKAASGASFDGANFSFKTENGQLKLISALINGAALTDNTVLKDIPYDSLQIELVFNEPIEATDLISKFKTIPPVDLHINISDDNTTVTLKNIDPLDYYRQYIFIISATLNSASGFDFAGFDKKFITGLNPTVKMPPLSDEELLDKVQQQTFRYFWDYAHPVSGMARERFGSGETVTTGGSGFGVMAIISAIDRGFISRDAGVERLMTITDFLTTADRFHGVWPHWMNGSNGSVIPFSGNDNGGDLVETSFMAAALLSARQYLNPANNTELFLISKINELLETIEWDWYTRNGQNVLYWHWSPSVGWAMNMQIKGYNEALITYFMAAASDQHGISADVYHNGWANSSHFINGKQFYGIELPLGFDYGGPLFFAHYSFLGLDPRGLSDNYANYWTQNLNHSLINRQHCVENPGNFMAYSAECWGLTASDDPDGYAVHEPTRDNGTITPTAALSSMPYTPEESMEALRHFYFILGDKLWGEYGFYDAFNPDKGWWTNSYLAIDQGTTMVMIENHRSGLLWELFMSAPETQNAMDKLGFSSRKY